MRRKFKKVDKVEKEGRGRNSRKLTRLRRKAKEEIREARLRKKFEKIDKTKEEGRGENPRMKIEEKIQEG